MSETPAGEEREALLAVAEELREAQSSLGELLPTTTAAFGATAGPGPALGGSRGLLPHSAALGNARIHPRSAYAEGAPDFRSLAQRQPDLLPFLKAGPGGRAGIDFKSFDATRALTRALLKEDYGISWWLPDGHLCPTLTSRVNYSLWVQDLLRLSAPPAAATDGGGLRGIDIGTGASAIYALLCAAAFGWRMLATDVTDAALAGAAANVAANPQLAELVELRDARAEGRPSGAAVLDGVLRDGESGFGFCMCNPPFFDSLADASRNPRTACGGSPAEMVYPGGEAAFVRRIVEDSRSLGTRVWWYTSLLGKKATLRALVAELRGPGGPAAIRTTEFSQGKTQRWGLAWSYTREAAAAQIVPLRRMGDQLSGAASEAKPASKAQLLLRVGRGRGAAARAMEALAEAAQRSDAVAESSVDPCSPYELRGVLRGDGAESEAWPFSIRIAEATPGELTILAMLSSGIASAQEAAQQAFGRMWCVVKTDLEGRKGQRRRE